MLENISTDFPAYPKDGIYLDSVTIGLQPKIAIDAQRTYVENIGNTVRKGLHRHSRITTEKYIQAKEDYATFLGGKSENYAWIPNSDYGWNMIINSIIHKNNNERIKFITSIYDHHSLLAPLIYLKKRNLIELTFLGMEEEYNLSECIELNADENSVLALSHVSPLFGLRRDISSIVDCAISKGALTVIDYSRSAGQNQIDLKNVSVAIVDGSLDLLGPQGCGLLYINENSLEKFQNPMPGSGGVRFVTSNDLGQMRNIERFETGNPNIAGMIGLAAAINYLKSLGKDKIILHRIELQNYLIKRIVELSSVKLIDPLMDTKMGNPNRASILCFNIGELSSHDIALLLDETHNISVRSGMICTHPGLFSLGLEEVVQISTHLYNSKNEIDKLIEGLIEIESMIVN